MIGLDQHILFEIFCQFVILYFVLLVDFDFNIKNPLGLIEINEIDKIIEINKINEINDLKCSVLPLLLCTLWKKNQAISSNRGIFCYYFYFSRRAILQKVKWKVWFTN